MHQVLVVAYNENWPRAYITASEQIAAAMDGNLVAIHHIGSTSIEGIYAKPIIDLLVVAKDLAVVDQQNDQMAALGYEGLGEFGIPGRRYFRRNDSSGQRTEQVHVFGHESPQVVRHLAFRDFLRVTPDLAMQYSDLKRALAAAHPNDINAYMDGKDGFIKEVEAKALAWIEGTRIRTAARLILLDENGRVLLFRYSEGFGREWWGTPGGGVEPGETLRKAARREAREELGLEVADLSPLWVRHAHFTFARRPLSQTETFFLVAAHSDVIFDHDLMETHRKEGILEMRWWDVRELEQTAELVFPTDLATRIAGARRT